MTHLTTHILDATRGAPAADVSVTLARHLPSSAAEPVAAGRTDADGRLAIGPDVLAPGTYALTFATGEYFAELGVEGFYPQVTVTFTVTDERHYHVPLLLSPFSYSTYRGS
ncbi:hydroxyisourate hydrolase [Microbacterium caowuchunii]|uniref:hydroxyisourate hydrolase n=1 Tax=Microbacterium caowuchunii TaxID=2614638 RepID=UPI0012455BDC|nr:hydroxyisourate hydrolase [Microbacterium caowuchunii]QEV98724.1 hydroxyisourate hydrolase [Microbacterium caowuchunii]